MEEYKPPFRLTEKMMCLVAEISEHIGKLDVARTSDTNLYLRKKNRIRTIHASLAIENNTLSLEQVTAILDGKRVLGKPSEIQEVKNAFEAYERILSFNPFSIDDLLKAHGLMMRSLVSEAGAFRSGSVGVFNGDKLVHLAPPAQFVLQHVGNLLRWVETSDLPMLLKSCIFHYEFEFIHPFQDGNGRMGRMWQTLLLSTANPLFVYLPIETLIRDRQQDYYDALAAADAAGDCAAFVEFLLQVISDSLPKSGAERIIPEKIQRLLDTMGDVPMSAKELMGALGLTRGQTLRDSYLKPAIAAGFIAMTEPDHPNSRNQKYYKK